VGLASQAISRAFGCQVFLHFLQARNLMAISFRGSSFAPRSSRRRSTQLGLIGYLAVCPLVGLGMPAWAADSPAAVSPEAADSPAAVSPAPKSPAAMAAMVTRAADFLKTRQQPNGAFSPESGPGVTALVTTALLRHGRGPEDPVVAGGLKYLESMAHPSGGIHAPESLYQNYETCLAIMCFVEANRDGRYDALLKKADAFVRDIQWDAGEGLESADPGYGGAGYGNHKRPDLSNTAFLVEALHALGHEANDEAIQQALVFVSRCQNLESPHNQTPFAAKVGDGGFYYSSAAGGSSQAGTDANGGLRSYASMTYAGLKSMIFAGVDAEDPRVKAATAWIARHYNLKTNPGMGTSGLFYYYHTFAKALDALGTETFVDEQGVSHAWRDELQAELASRQRSDGSWTNDDKRWLESNPDLVTGYALLALSYARPAGR
jgi:squalene-hopene/tetraprenyl-beta-curcumene cyclase